MTERRVDVKLSKKLAFILRHGAKDAGMTIEKDGFIPLDEILKHKKFSGVSVDRIVAVVENDAKSRYALRIDECVFYCMCMRIRQLTLHAEMIACFYVRIKATR